MATEELDRMREYFTQHGAISFAVLFGSRSTGRARSASDFDIGVYFTPRDRRTVEYEECAEYPERERIEKELEALLKREVDLIVRNKAPSNLAFEIVTHGVPILVKDEELFARFLQVTTLAAMDYRELVRQYYEMFHRATSLSEGVPRLESLYSVQEATLTGKSTLTGRS